MSPENSAKTDLRASWKRLRTWKRSYDRSAAGHCTPDNLVQLHLESKQLNVCSCGGKRGAPAHAEANRGNCPAAEGLRSQPLHRNSGIIRVRFPGLGLGYCGL